MRIFKIIPKSFSNKVMSIPPKFRNQKTKGKDKISPIYNLIKSQKLVESHSERMNVEEKMDYETIVRDASKVMLMNHFKTYDDKTTRLKDIRIFNEYIKKVLSARELELILIYIKELKKIIESQNVEKTEEIFKIFIDKVYNISSNKILTKTLINMISKIPIKETNTDEIFNKISNMSALTAVNEGNKNSEAELQKSIYYFQLESNFNTTLKIRNPLTSDVDDHEDDIKDAFQMKHDFTFKEPFLIQENSHLTKFEKTRCVSFSRMPFIYPVWDKTSQKMIFKHVNNELVIKNGINLKTNPNYKRFIEKYLIRALTTEKKNGNINYLLVPVSVTVGDFYNSKTQTEDYYDIHLMNEASDFIEEVFENRDESKLESMKNISRYRNYYKNEIGDRQKIYNIDKIFQNTKYLEYRKNELDKIVQRRFRKEIYCSGIAEFNTYEEKKSFLNSGAGIFGLHLQGFNINFSDSDFCNYLFINSFLEDANLNDILHLLNYILKSTDCSIKLQLPNYFNEISAYPVDKKLEVKENVYVRFNSFSEAYKVHNIINNGDFNRYLKSKFKKPTQRYYGGFFFNGLELVIKNSCKDIQKILSIESNYLETNNLIAKDLF